MSNPLQVAVIGANGQLGIDACKAFNANGNEVIELNHADVDIANHNAVHSVLAEHQPHLVINTAAMHNVEACEDNPAKAFAVNGIGARNLAMVTKAINCTLIHISTDYVFNGAQHTPYTEQDLPIPLNVYGNTKLSGEHFIQTMAEKYFILRVSGLYGHNLCRAKGGLNFVSLMLKLAQERDEIRVVNDEFVSPTYTADIAQQIVHISQSTAYGLYHTTAQGSCSWHEFATKIFELTNTQTKLLPANPGEFPAKVPRPSYSVLANTALQTAGLDIMPHWQDGLKQYLGTTP